MSLPRRSSVTELDRALLEMERERDMIQQQLQTLDLNIKNEEELMRKSTRDGMNEKALQHLKNMEDQRQIQERLEEMLGELEDKILDLELSRIRAETNDTVRNIIEDLQNRNSPNEILDENPDGNADVTNSVEAAPSLVKTLGVGVSITVGLLAVILIIVFNR